MQRGTARGGLAGGARGLPPEPAVRRCEDQSAGAAPAAARGLNAQLGVGNRGQAPVKKVVLFSVDGVAEFGG